MVGMYRIENTSSEHASVLKYTVMAWGERQPDVYLVSKEGVKVYTQRILLSFYSKTIGEILDGNRDDLAGVSVPVSSSSLTMMLKVLVSGSVIATNKDDLLEVGQAAEALGIVLNDRQIGYKKTNKIAMAGKGVVKETVQISGKKVSYRKSVNSASEIKTEPLEESNEEDMDLSENVASDLKDRSKLKKTKKYSVDGPESGIVDDKTFFPSASRLSLHMNVHKDEKERPYKCDVCEKGFSAPASLKNHKLLHTGEKLKCEYCDYTAVQKGNLKSHRLKLHKDVLVNTGFREDLDGNQGDASGETEIKEDFRNEELKDVSENNEPEEEVGRQDDEDADADEEKTIEQFIEDFLGEMRADYFDHEEVVSSSMEVKDTMLHMEFNEAMFMEVNDAMSMVVNDVMNMEVKDVMNMEVKDAINMGVKDAMNMGVKDAMNMEVKDAMIMEVNDAMDMVVKDASNNSVSIDDIDRKIKEMIFVENGCWGCKKCGKVMRKKQHISNHAESHLEGYKHPCHICGKCSRTRNALTNHIHYAHKHPLAKIAF